MEDYDFKICPFCKERIRVTAVKCRFCGEWLEQPPAQTPSQPVAQEPVETLSSVVEKVQTTHETGALPEAPYQPSADDLLLGEKVFRDLAESNNIYPSQEQWEHEFLLRKNLAIPIPRDSLEKIWIASDASGRKPLPKNEKQSVVCLFQDLSRLTTILKTLLILGAVVGVIAVVSGIMQAILLNQSFTVAEGKDNDTRQQIVGYIQVGLYLVTVVVFGRWIYLANQNVCALGAKNLTVTPGWAVGYFFIPIVCLWKPYQAMKELWRASQNPAAWQSITASQILPGWWTLWIAYMLFARASASELKNAHAILDFQTGTYTQIASDVINIGLCIIAMALVSQIWSAQKKVVRPS
jgi:hypothetical protein